MYTPVLVNDHDNSDVFFTQSDSQKSSSIFLPNNKSIQRFDKVSLTFKDMRIGKQIQLVVLIVVVIVIGGLNRVTGKIVTVPMGEYSFFLGLFNDFMYVFLYGGILTARIALGIVAKKQIVYVWRGNGKDSCIKSGLWPYFLAIGFLDGLSNILLLISSPYLPGPVISLLSQSTVPFSIIAARLFLSTAYTFWQIWSVLLLVFGVTATLMPDFTPGALNSSPTLYCIVMALSTLPQALSVTLKEKVFRNQLKVDLFVVNTHGSLFQLLLFPLFLPLTIFFNQTGGTPLLQYIHDGFQCFVGNTPIEKSLKSDCGPDPYPYLVYICFNLAFNLVLLLLVKKASAVLSFLTIQAVLPVSVILFYLRWPLLSPTAFSGWTVGGLVVILVALVLFQVFTVYKNKNDLECMSIELPRSCQCHRKSKR